MKGQELAGGTLAADAMDQFSRPTRDWFLGAFSAPTPAQNGAWGAISSGSHALVVAPTGSGKTLAAFLWALDRLLVSAPAEPQLLPGLGAVKGTRAKAPKPTTRVLYISPLKALGVDVERNLRAPLIGITQTAKRLGLPAPLISVGVRSGDTPASERRTLLSHPPDILITTPESLFLMLTSKARETLSEVDTIIVDEVHAVAGTKRGAHLAVSLERLDALLSKPAQRIGLSATVEPKELVAQFLAGAAPVQIVAPPSKKNWDLTVSVPVEDMSDLQGAAGAFDSGPASGLQPQASIWPHVEEKIVDLVLANQSTIVFANSRRLAERLTARLNEIYAERQLMTAGGWAGIGAGAPDVEAADAGVRSGGPSGSAAAPPTSTATPAPTSTATPAHMMAQAGSTAGADPVLARAHHGSVSKDQRALIEDDLKSGRLRCVVATSSLELGIDMGAVDLVVQVESPPSVASGLQRVGRAGHQVGEISQGVLFPKHRADLVHTAITVERMLGGKIERLSVPANPLDILAQQTVAATALGAIDVEEWFSAVRRSAPFASLPRSAFEATLDLLAGRYPSDEFAELRPRIIWDRNAGTIEGRPGAQRLAVTSGGTIPDRGLFGVYIIGTEVEGSGSSGGASADGRAASPAAAAAKGGRRVGELDEEMVYESRVGDVFALGATSWKIEDITHDRVLVSPAFGQPGKLPFWKGDSLGRPVDLGRALGAFVRELSASDVGPAMERCKASGLDDFAANNLIQYLAEQKLATEVVPSDTTLVVERFLDELGDWRVVLHSPFGMPVHAPWALAVGQRLHQRYGVDGSAMAADDGIVLRVPMMEDEPPGAELFLFDSEELEQIVTAEVGGSALFASRFRECAARALLLPRQTPGKRQPLWQQRQRSAQLLDVARKYPTFPIVLETVRECLQDVYDLPALKDIAASVERRELRIVQTTTQQPSPFAKSLLFGYVAQFLYEGDSPLAERRAAALALDSTLLNELLGRVELRELLDAKVIDATERELQRLAPDRKVRGVEGVADLLRLLGPLTPEEVAARLEPPAESVEPAPVARPADAAETFPVVEPAGVVEPAEVVEPAGTREDAPELPVADAAAHLTALQRANRAIKVNIGGGERFAAVEDAARLRDALGVPLPMGVPLAFIEPVADPLGDLVSRYARTHGPFTSAEAAARLGLGVAVVGTALKRLAADGRVVEGEFRPHATAPEPPTATETDGVESARGGGAAEAQQTIPPIASSLAGVSEWCDAEVLRKLRRRSLAALRAEVEPVDAAAYGRFLPAWQNVRAPGRRGQSALRGLDGIVTAVDQLSGVPVPASAWEPLVLASRVADYQPAMLDELMAAGEVLWSGAGSLPGNDGWVSLHLADSAELTLNPAVEFEPGDAQLRLLDHLRNNGGGYFFRQLAEIAGGMDSVLSDQDVVSALWDLAWAGRITGDTFAPVRALIAGGHTAHRQVSRAPRARAPRLSRLGRSHGTGLLGSPGLTGGRYGSVTGSAPTPPLAAGRWSALPAPELDPTIHARATAELLLDRYGVVTRGSVMAENILGGFGLMYKVLARLEEAGRCRRGYFIEHLGAAQFAVPATVDRLRSYAEDTQLQKPEPSALALAATDPANPYGAALPWPALNVEAGTGHRPGRKAGALVVLVDGDLVLYVERGGKTLLVFSDDTEILAAAGAALVRLVTRGAVDKLIMEKVNGHGILDTPVAAALAQAGAYSTPKGLRIRA
ncbi:Lhr family ATP-dependent helicase [Arthrobacter sp. UYCu723]